MHNYDANGRCYGTFAYNIKVNSEELVLFLVSVVWLRLWGDNGYGWGGVLVKAPLNSIWKSSSVSEHILALVHDPLDVGLGVAVKLNDSSVKSLHFSLSIKAVFEVINVLSQLLDVSLVSTGFPVVFTDLLSVECDLGGILINFFLCPFNSLNQLRKNDSGGLNGNDLVGVDIDLMCIAIIVDGWFVDAPFIDGVAKAFWGNRASIAIVVVWAVSGLVMVVSLNADGKGEGCNSGFHELVKLKDYTPLSLDSFMDPILIPNGFS